MRIPAVLSGKAGVFLLLAVWFPAMMINRWVWLSWILLLMIVAAFEAFVWPRTRYSAESDRIRADRFGVDAQFGLLGMIGLRWLFDEHEGWWLFDEGFMWAFTAFITIGATDTFASVVGAFFGKKKGVARESASKSREGFIGGYVGGFIMNAVLASVLVYGVIQPELSTWVTTGLILALSLIVPYDAIQGDLQASGAKRSLFDQRGAGIKDFGGFFWTHGGVLDRVDGQVRASRWYYVLALIILIYG